MYINVITNSCNLPMTSNIETSALRTNLSNYLTVSNDEIAWFVVIIFKHFSGSSFSSFSESLFIIFLPMILLSINGKLTTTLSSIVAYD
jgi:hypothetical protein